ncbi:hypothetical protein [Paenibacillus yonginensis]|nr:hypothetical protein [Paenibacillus yonginensis]
MRERYKKSAQRTQETGDAIFMLALDAKNRFFETSIDGKKIIKFITGGKCEVEVLVDVKTWVEYLHKHHWTAIKKDNYIQVKTSIDKHSHRLPRMIIENEYSKLDYWGNTIDHENNNPMDNRLSNLRIYNSKLNVTNIRSKYKDDDMHLIYPQYSKVKNGKRIYGYKVHTNISDETKYKNFKTKEEAKEYRDNIILPLIESKIEELKKSQGILSLKED